MPSARAAMAEVEGATDTDSSSQKWVKGTVLDREPTKLPVCTVVTYENQ
jgi:hypothetical protein